MGLSTRMEAESTFNCLRRFFRKMLSVNARSKLAAMATSISCNALTCASCCSVCSCRRMRWMAMPTISANVFKMRTSLAASSRGNARRPASHRHPLSRADGHTGHPAAGISSAQPVSTGISSRIRVKVAPCRLQGCPRQSFAGSND